MWEMILIFAVLIGQLIIYASETTLLNLSLQDLQETVHPLVAILRHNKGQKVEQAPVFADKVLY